MKLSGTTIRSKFIQFFHQRYGHLVMPSASLIPTNPTVLLTPAGMLPFVPIFLGIEPPPAPPRAVSCQKCARISGKASDLEFVGRTTRHHTFFEMLGNFSFGDYFKELAIQAAWEFVTEELKLPKEQLWVSVFYKDQEARAIWENTIGLPREKVKDMDEKDNFWGPPGPTGPCGPCSEIYFDRGPAYGDNDDDRHIEIWNLVFMELFKDAEGNFTPLEKKNIDTGMGLERITMVVQDVANTFETDLLFPILKKLADMTGCRYHDNPEQDIHLKIVTDHIRCVTFAIADGIMPSNEGRGYIIRMVLRRAIRYAKKLGINEPMLFKLVSTVRDLYQETYPEVKQHYDLIVDTVKAEEKRFMETLERGSKLLDEMIAELKAQGKSVMSGEEVFKLYDTYGFPLELTTEMAAEQGLSVDEPGFEQAMEAQRTRARSAQEDKALVSDQVYSEILSEFGPTRFLGYDATEAQGKIIALIQDGKRVDQFGGTNQPFEVILDQTPFYAESGGQVGDRGILYVADGERGQTIVVQDAQKVGDLVIHKALFDQGGSITVGQAMEAEVNVEARIRTMAHHSVTHLLHAALKKLLGDRVQQAGSRVGPDGARFDFTFQRGLTKDEVHQLETMVNRWVFENHDRTLDVLDPETAKAQGAIAMFGEKYGDQVRVISFGPHSKELCGGTHVNRTGDIGLFRITSEGAIASGVRRVEYLAGETALRYTLMGQSELENTAGLLKVGPSEIAQRVEKLLEERKDQEKQIRGLQEKLALSTVQQLLDKYRDQADRILVEQVAVESADSLKFVGEQLAQRLPQTAVMLGANVEGRALFIALVPDSWQKAGIKAGEIVKEAAGMCEGGGGGKPNFAQAGGKRGDLVFQAIDHIRGLLQERQQTITP